MASNSYGAVAALFFNSIPEDQRRELVRKAAQDLNAKSNASDASLVATLLQQSHDDEARADLIGYLQSSIVEDDGKLALSLSNAFPDIESSLLDIVTKYISWASSYFRQESKWVALVISLNEEVATSNGDTKERTDNFISVLAKLSAYLQVVVDISLKQLHQDAASALLLSSCVLMGAADHIISTRARACILELLKTHPQTCTDHSTILWNCMLSLINSKLAFYKQSGHLLLLRWISSDATLSKSILQDPVYWDTLHKGLRFGDSEQRKSSLYILKSSVDIAVDDADLFSIISYLSSSSISPEIVRQHYIRFCTVYETIVLGRYLNQVQECEPDLDFLSSSSSAVRSPWLLTLLASALDPEIQDSNRKFIGSWIARSTLRIDDWPSYINFFQLSLLPWFMQGHFFTSSLRKVDDRLICLHGENLSTYIQGLSVTFQDTAHVNSIIDVILIQLVSRQGSNFAYARVYLLEGFRRLLEVNANLTLSIDQITTLKKLLTWTGFPEVARDFVHLRSWKLLHDLTKRHSALVLPDTEAKSERWTSIRDKVRQLDPSSVAQTHGTVASWEFQISNRDIKEEETIRKCTKLISDLQEATTISTNSTDLDERLNDIWSDLDYLEYPKDLLIVLPTLVLNRQLLGFCSKHGGDFEVVNKTLLKMLQALIDLSRSRAYLLSPMLDSIRWIVEGGIHESFPIEIDNFIVQLTEELSTVTVDAQLEDATVHLIQNIDAGFGQLSYEYYFGPRESYGFALLLDIVNRLHASNFTITKKIFSTLMNRWLNQKIPPPTVSVWKNTLQLQVLLICSEQIVPAAEEHDAQQILKDFHYILSVEPLPRYRYLLEWIISRIYIHHPNLKPVMIEELRTKDHHSNPKFLASLMKIGIRIAKSSDSDEDFAFKLANTCVPLAASSKVVIRHEAQWQVPVLLDYAQLKDWKTITTNTAFLELDTFIRSLKHFDDPPLERRVDGFNPIADHTMTNLVEGAWFELDDVEPRLCRREDFEKIFAVGLTNSQPLPTPCIPLGNKISLSHLPKKDQQAAASDQTRRILQNIDNISRALGAGPGPTALQTKGNAHLETQRTRHTNLLVVASLINNPYNLGGLSRASEIFGAGALYLQNANVASNRDFTNVSVSSHFHLPLLPLSIAMMQEFLAKKRKDEGFTVVGIEQTDRSVLLGAPECILPEKCVLVMGSEREGIPALVLSECDLLVEIPQVGVTRSLNVQTAAAIVLCEYAKQHRR